MSFFSGKSGKDLDPGEYDAESGAMRTTPWLYRAEGGLYYGADGAWLYRKVPTDTIQYGNAAQRLAAGDSIKSALSELSKAYTDSNLLAQLTTPPRDFHVITLVWDDDLRPSLDETPAQYEFLENVFEGLSTRRKVVFVGVKLQNSLSSVTDAFKDMLYQATGDQRTNPLKKFESDVSFATTKLSNEGLVEPSLQELSILESWYNLGRGTDAAIDVASDRLRIQQSSRHSFDLEFLAVQNWELDHYHNALAMQWADLAERADLDYGAIAISIRGSLLPAQKTRSKLRRAQRKGIGQLEESQKSGDLQRQEDYDLIALQQSAEDAYTETSEPSIQDCSIIVARHKPVDSIHDSFATNLRDLGVTVKPLLHRQLEALEECLPCSKKRANPFLQHVNLSTVAHSGITNFMELGDSRGCWIGFTTDGAPVYYNVGQSALQNQPPVTVIAADSGGGKTVAMQLMAHQAVNMGISTVFINPKGYDTLEPFAKHVGGEVIHMQKLLIDEDGKTLTGALDPFRYAEPGRAKDIAINHIMSNFSELTTAELIPVQHAFQQALVQGSPRCVGDCLAYMPDGHLKEQIIQLASAEPLFGLGVGLKPQDEFKIKKGALTLIEFDYSLPLPGPSVARSEYTPKHRAAVSALLLVATASTQILTKSSPGFLLVDEAWSFFRSYEGANAVNELARIARSLNVQMVFASQQISDFLEIDLESYVSRLVGLTMSDVKEAEQVLRVAGVKNPIDHVGPMTSGEWKATRPSEGRAGLPARGMHQDSKNRIANVWLGPIPKNLLDSYSTNPEDKERRRKDMGLD